MRRLSGGTYAWWITNDFTTAIADDVADGPASGRSGGTPASEALYDYPTIYTWRCYDKDGQAVCQGVIFGNDTGYEPLDEFCGPVYGCTEIRYLIYETGEWRRYG